MDTKNKWYWFVVTAMILATAVIGYRAWQKRAASEVTDSASLADNEAMPPPPHQIPDAGPMLAPVTPARVAAATPCGATERRGLERLILRLGAGQPFFMATLCGGEHLLAVMLSQAAVREDGSPVVIARVTVDGELSGQAAQNMEEQFFLHHWEQFGPYPTLLETSRLSDFGSIVVGQLFISLFQAQPCTTRLQYRSRTAEGRERLAGFTASMSGCWSEGHTVR